MLEAPGFHHLCGADALRVLLGCGTHWPMCKVAGHDQHRDHVAVVSGGLDYCADEATFDDNALAEPSQRFRGCDQTSNRGRTRCC
jgi:hypothetical protein